VLFAYVRRKLQIYPNERGNMAAIQKIIQMGRDNKISELREYLANQVRLPYNEYISFTFISLQGNKEM
jgi:hypothetical protein